MRHDVVDQRRGVREVAAAPLLRRPNMEVSAAALGSMANLPDLPDTFSDAELAQLDDAVAAHATAKAAARLGVDKLHDWQRQVLAAVGAGRDCVVLSGTGSGKSCCFQVPPLATGRPAVVVSPLISLMRDQVKGLESRGIRACFLGSAQPDSSVEARALAGEFSLVYACPETLCRLLPRLHRAFGRFLGAGQRREHVVHGQPRGPPTLCRPGPT